MASRILVVEDDTVARLLLVKVLEDAGFQVAGADSGEMALDLLDRHRFDLVVSDIRMRAVDGLGVLSAARRQPSPPAVILLTGHASLESAIAALRHGAMDYLLKPCDPALLVERVRAALSRHASEQSQSQALQKIAEGLAQLRDGGGGPAPPGEPQRSAAGPPPPGENERYRLAGQLRIDTFRHLAWYAEERLHLTPIEYDLLLGLLEAAGRVMTYSEIVQRTHGYQASESEAQTLIKAHVRNLRRKLPPSFLLNVRGVGYVLGGDD